MTIDEPYWKRTYQAGLATSLDLMFGTDTWWDTRTRELHLPRPNQVSRDHPALSYSAWLPESVLGHIQLEDLYAV